MPLATVVLDADPQRELDEARPVPGLMVHEEAHCLPQDAAVGDAVVVVQVEHVRVVRQQSGHLELANKQLRKPSQVAAEEQTHDGDQGVEGAGFHVMLEPRLLLPRHVEQPRQLVPRGVLIAGVPKKNLDTMNQTPSDVSLRWHVGVRCTVQRVLNS